MLAVLRRSAALILPAALMAFAAAPAMADNVTAVNQIFNGGTCMGSQCADGEIFGSLPQKIKTGDTPGLRLEQTNSSGFTPQVWDVAGNEANFFVRDITGGSKLPLRIRPGAQTSMLDLFANSYASTSGVFAFDTNTAIEGTGYDTSNILNGLAGLTFQTYKVNGGSPDLHLQPVIGPFASSYFGDTQYLAPADVSAVALAAAQQLKASSDASAQRIAALESSNTTLQNDVAALKKKDKSMAKTLKSLQKQVKKLAKRK